MKICSILSFMKCQGEIKREIILVVKYCDEFPKYAIESILNSHLPGPYYLILGRPYKNCQKNINDFQVNFAKCIVRLPE